MANGKKYIYMEDFIKKIKVLRTRVRSFKQNEIQRLLNGFCVEIWDKIKNYRTGKLAYPSLMITVGEETFTIWPSNRKKRNKYRVNCPSKTFDIDKLINKDRLFKFGVFVRDQLVRMGDGLSINSFNNRPSKETLIIGP